MLETDVRHAAKHQAQQVVVRKESRGHDLGEDIEGGGPLQGCHHRQVDQLFDRSTANLPPDLVVFRPDLFFYRMRRPPHTDATQIFEAQLDTAITAIQGGVQLQSQACDRGTVDEGRATVRELGEALFCGRQLTAQKFARRAVKLQCKHERIAVRPGVLRQQPAAGAKISQRRGICR